jgi:hypothetical protein
MMALVMALLYVPAMVHCSLEQVGFLGEMSCCANSKQPHEDQTASCEYGCCPLESSGYFSRQKTSLGAPVIVDYGFVLCVFEADLAQKAAPLLRPGPPPELLKIWQFSSRTALSPRAPSLVS